jgi:hypothetical protein
MVKRAARKAGINEAVSPHWLRHTHGSHASLPEVQSTLGHGNIATTSGYLHARPNTSSGLHLDPGVFLDCLKADGYCVVEAELIEQQPKKMGRQS